jgi:hypothetical protein
MSAMQKANASECLQGWIRELFMKKQQLWMTLMEVKERGQIICFGRDHQPIELTAVVFRAEPSVVTGPNAACHEREQGRPLPFDFLSHSSGALGLSGDLGDLRTQE